MLRRLRPDTRLARCCRYLTDAPPKSSDPYLITTGLTANVAKGQMRSLPVSALPRSKYGGITHVSLLTGSTIIGQQGAKFVTALLHSTRVPVELQRIASDQEEEYFNSVLRNHAAVHVDILCDGEAKKKSLKICNDLDLYVFMTRLRSFPGFKCRFPDVDIQVIAQNNIGNYSELEYSPVKGVVEALRVVTHDNVEKYLRYAFKAAIRAGRCRVTLIHKANEWPVTDGAMLKIAEEMHAKKYSSIELEVMELDECVKRLITDPAYFDTIFTNDRYATFLATICSGVAGGANLFSAIELGDNHAVFKPLQTKLSLTNYSQLSPYGIVSTCVDLLNHVGHESCAKSLWQGMIRTMDEGVKSVEFDGTDTGEYVICNIMNKLRCSALGESAQKK
ncbi:isocitrate dehydrogenase [NAD] subunit gamma, mitochondrial [Drosophila subobscura]|uniref:isocitrate dehydrogenase [NAD] subunit gamma, mitochondrial n=1 Tax=Drosophila subobscura TaxID=7241 RepID=UPI00155AD6CC|nr:isocitrate dehydrogenase [NAD] subunit gamma, mitochondrial [Drosophila subobscura]